jgi:hypothetical protein
MNRDQAISRVAFRLGNRTQQDFLDQILEEMLLAQTILEQSAELPWFLASSVNALSAFPAVGSESFLMPADFLRMLDEGEGGFWVLNPESGMLQRLSLRWSYEELAQQFTSEPSDLPLYLAIVGLYGYVRPVPDADYAYSANYYAADETLETNIENKWTKYAPDLIIAQTMKQVAESLQDTTALAQADRDLARATDRLVRSNVARREMGYERIIGGED